VTAALHRLGCQPSGPVEAWFAEPVGAPAWQAMLGQAADADAEWARPLAR